MTKATKRMFTRYLSIIMITLLIIANPGTLNGVNGQASAEVDYDSLHTLLITESVPYYKNVSDDDGYEYIEVYNNSDQTINFKDYQIIYRYPATHDEDVHWIPENRDLNIGPGDTLVLWMQNADNTESTVEDFNNNYEGADLVENENIVKMDGGMANQKSEEHTSEL